MLELARPRLPYRAGGSEADDEARASARRARGGAGGEDFGRADEIRERLAELGWEVRDSPRAAPASCRGAEMKVGG